MHSLVLDKPTGQQNLTGAAALAGSPGRIVTAEEDQERAFVGRRNSHHGWRAQVNSALRWHNKYEASRRRLSVVTQLSRGVWRDELLHIAASYATDDWQRCCSIMTPMMHGVLQQAVLNTTRVVGLVCGALGNNNNNSSSSAVVTQRVWTLTQQQ